MWVTVHAEIPAASVAGLTVTLSEIPVKYTKADNRGELVAKFLVDDVEDILEPGTMVLTLSGMTLEGKEFFSGTDTIRVVKVSGKR